MSLRKSLTVVVSVILTCLYLKAGGNFENFVMLDVMKIPLPHPFTIQPLPLPVPFLPSYIDRMRVTRFLTVRYIHMLMYQQPTYSVDTLNK